MSSNSRKLNYALAINEAIAQMMEIDESVFVIGQGVKSPWYVGQTCKDLIKKFGSKRVIDTPVSENAVTGAAVGAAIAGMKSIVVHPRVDFMMYALDPIFNEASNWHYMYGGASSVPVVIWGIINRGGEQGAQHSQALQAMFAHFPGLKVVMPSNAYDAKGLMVAAINDPNPVVFLDDRWLYSEESEVPEGLYEVEIGKANVIKEGNDLTIVSSSFMTHEAIKAAAFLSDEDIDIEIVDLRTISPVDEETIINSVQKTKKVMIVDASWKSFGVSSEITAIIAEKAFNHLVSPVKRLALPDTPAPANRDLEDEYYLKAEDIIQHVREML